MRILIAAAALLALVACRHSFSKPGATSDDFAHDKQECALYAHELGGGAIPQKLKFNECMEERGWARD